MKHVADGLRTVPIAGLASVRVPRLRNTVNSEGTHILVCDVVHEESKDSIVLIKLGALLRISEGLLEAERVSEHVPLETLEEQHLTAAKHTTPTGVARIVRSVQRLFQHASIGEPSDRAKRTLQLISYLL